MTSYIFNSVDEGVYVLTQYLRAQGIEEDSRNGPVVQAPGVTMVTWARPERCVLSLEERGANPFLFLFDALHVLMGREDVGFLTQFSERFNDFSDDGVALRGAYGFRLREKFGVDQLQEAIKELRGTKLQSRRAVLQIYSAADDLHVETRDVPCNIAISLHAQRGKLDMTVFNRSNDLYWGMCGANVVQFSLLGQYIAGHLGIPFNSYTQVSTNLHAYKNFGPWDKLKDLAGVPVSAYEISRYVHVPLLNRTAQEIGPDFDADLDALSSGCEDEDVYLTTFFQAVVLPMWLAWKHHKAGDNKLALEILEPSAGIDWIEASKAYIKRRM